MKRIFFSVLLFFTAFVMRSEAQNVQHLSDSTTAIRPADIITNDIRWNRASTDDFTYWLASGLYGFYGPQPTIFVDGLPIDANYFGWQNLNMLPVSNAQKITYSLHPQVRDGSLAPAGFVNFRSTPIDTGFAASASYYVGNETGDPGPYNYDPTKVTPNIDRWGPDGAIQLSYLKSGWYAKTNYEFRNNKPTDLALNSRLHFTASRLGTNKGYLNHLIDQGSKSGLFETGFRNYHVQVRARVALGQSSDYLFLQPFGREIPAETAYRQISVEGKYRTGHLLFTGHYIGHQKTIGKRYEIHPYIFDWDQRNHTGNLSVTYHSRIFSLTPGASYQRLLTNAPGLGATPHDLANISLRGAVHPKPNDSLRVRLNVDYDEQNTAKTWGLRYARQVVRGWKIIPAVTHTEVLPLRQHSFSYWVNRGYTFANFLNITYSPSARVGKNSLTYFEFENKITFAPHLTFTLDPRLVHHYSINVPYQQVKSDEFFTDTKPGLFTETQEEGNRLRVYGELRYRFNHLLTQSLALNIQRSLSGSKRYKTYFNQIPETKFQYRIRLQPTRGLRLSARLLYRSSTRWNEFQAIEGNKFHLPNGIPIRKVEGTFRTRTPAYTNITLGVGKWFLDRHINAKFMLHNLLDEPVRMHPIGAKLSTKFDLKINIHI